MQRRSQLKVILVGIAMVIIYAGSPIIMRLAYLDDRRCLKANKFIPSTVNDVGFLATWMMSQAFATWKYGLEGFKRCYSIREILNIAPVSILYALAEALSLFAIQSVAPTLFAIACQSRLFLIAILSRLILRKALSATQVLITIILVAATLSFILSSHDGPHSLTSLENLGALGGYALLTSLATVLAEHRYHQGTTPVSIVMAQGRITALGASLIISIGYMYHKGWAQYGYFGGPDGGWDPIVWGLAAWFVLCDWSISLAIFQLGSMVKSVGAAFATALTYAMEAAIFARPWHTRELLNLVVICADTILYALDRLRCSQVSPQSSAPPDP